jgi:hypothetical protein
VRGRRLDAQSSSWHVRSSCKFSPRAIPPLYWTRTQTSRSISSQELEPEKYLRYIEAAEKAAPKWAAALLRAALPHGVSRLEALRAEIEQYWVGLREVAAMGRAQFLEEPPHFPPHLAQAPPHHGYTHYNDYSHPPSHHTQPTPVNPNLPPLAFSSSSNVGTSSQQSFGQSLFDPQAPAENPYLPTPFPFSPDLRQRAPTNLDFFPLPQSPPTPGPGHPSSDSHTFSLGRSQLSHRKAAIYGMLQPLSI